MTDVIHGFRVSRVFDVVDCRWKVELRHFVKAKVPVLRVKLSRVFGGVDVFARKHVSTRVRKPNVITLVHQHEGKAVLALQSEERVRVVEQSVLKDNRFPFFFDVSSDSSGNSPSSVDVAIFCNNFVLFELEACSEDLFNESLSQV